jgi:hypothetical protein
MMRMIRMMVPIDMNFSSARTGRSVCSALRVEQPPGVG